MEPYLFTGPKNAAHTLVLAHGSGASMDSPFMEEMATRLGELGVRVVRFEFPYMAKARQTGRKAPPNKAEILKDSWRHTYAALAGEGKLFIGGKSLGGRMASMVADELGAAGLICLGYPFHPPGKPERLRTAHLAELTCPTLILQGERDSFGNRKEVTEYSLSPSIQMHWLADGDHSLKPRKRSGLTLADNLTEASRTAASFIHSVTP